MMKRRALPSLVATIAVALSLEGRGEEPLDFARDVRPVLSDHCMGCHGGVRRKAGLSFLSRRDAAPAIVAGDPASSELIARITHDDPDERMPPGKPLPPESIELLRRWIAEGAAWPEHWSLEPLASIASLRGVSRDMSADEARGARGSIDVPIQRSLRAHGLTPSPDAPRTTLVRRLSLDLRGLPPTPEEIDAFTADDAPDAYERLVDRYLASPRFGERWGRHWLDQARYADSDGYEKDNARPDAWRWRDWVIDAMNADMPFDRFTVEQIAGDLLADAGPEQKLATAFHRQTLYNREGGVDPEEDRTKRVIDRVNTVGQVWLGLTVGCCQCHNHPYDPITQRDYYALYAFFNSSDEGVVEIAAADGAEVKARVLVERDERRATHVFDRGDFLRPRVDDGEVDPAALPAIAAFAGREGAPPDRLDLARWLVDERNPLTARVAVNTIWAHLFGRGLVSTAEDFGSRGAMPSHPELIDELAAELIESGWSRKSLIRRIVCSATYRQSSARRADAAAVDPENVLVWRQGRLRVEAEIVRDLHLAASGLLALRIGGPSVFPPLPADVAAQSYANNFKWKESADEDRYRRGMYTFFKRTAPDPNLMTFDCPDSNVSRTTRGRSNTPLQALATLHNEVYVEAARALATRVLGEPANGDRARLERAFRLCIARRPEAAELDALARLLERSRAWYADHDDDARALVGERAPASNAIETAAWTATVRIITNLDEFITRE